MTPLIFFAIGGFKICIFNVAFSCLWEMIQKLMSIFFEVAEPPLGIGDEIKPLCSMEYVPPFNHEFKPKHLCMLKQSP